MVFITNTVFIAHKNSGISLAVRLAFTILSFLLYNIASMIANEKRLKAKYEKALALAGEWQKKAENALKSGNEEMALKALDKKVEYESLAAQYEAARRREPGIPPS